MLHIAWRPLCVITERIKLYHRFSRPFQQGLLEWCFFEDAGLCGRTKTEILEYDDVKHHSACSVCKERHRIAIVLAISSGRVKTIHICYVWTFVYLFIALETEDKISVFPDTLVQGLISVQMALTLKIQ